MKVHLNIVKKNDKPISDVLKDYIIQNKKVSKGYFTNRIKTTWKESMGPTIYSYTKSIYFNKSTLYINITSSPLRQELLMSKSKIIDLINEKIGSNFINEVVIR